MSSATTRVDLRRSTRRQPTDSWMRRIHMASDMFILNADNELVPVRQGPYESEERLQEFLARCPDLLSGGQINPESPRRWLLVRREGGIPNAEAASDRWAVDHVFLDQDAVPTLVEVKRSSDTRIRREVVGQML